MTQEEKQLLLKDLCARLPYGVYVVDIENDKPISTAYIIYDIDIRFPFPKDCTSIKPYLRPMSSMTEEEENEYQDIVQNDGNWVNLLSLNLMEFYNKHHLDPRGLIAMGLALEAPEGMYKEK